MGSGPARRNKAWLGTPDDEQVENAMQALKGESAARSKTSREARQKAGRDEASPAILEPFIFDC